MSFLNYFISTLHLFFSLPFPFSFSSSSSSCLPLRIYLGLLHHHPPLLLSPLIMSRVRKPKPFELCVPQGGQSSFAAPPTVTAPSWLCFTATLPPSFHFHINTTTTITLSCLTPEPTASTLQPKISHTCTNTHTYTHTYDNSPQLVSEAAGEGKTRKESGRKESELLLIVTQQRLENEMKKGRGWLVKWLMEKWRMGKG